MFRTLKVVKHGGPLCLFAHGIEDWPAQQAEDSLRQTLAFCRKTESNIVATSPEELKTLQAGV